MREPFEVYNQKFGTRVDLHLFLSDYVVFTLAAVPFLVTLKRLFHHEIFEAVIETGLAVRGLLDLWLKNRKVDGFQPWFLEFR